MNLLTDLVGTREARTYIGRHRVELRTRFVGTVPVRQAPVVPATREA
jgi:hypothetical protein